MNIIEEGQTVKGEIKRVVDEAVFVDIGVGQEAVIPRKDIDKVKGYPQIEIQEGETVPVYIYHVPEVSGTPLGSIAHAIDAQGEQQEDSRVSNPWACVEESYHVGDLVEGTVTGIKRFGAFVELPNGIEGLIHVSELESGYTRSPWDVVKKGDKVRVRVIKIERQKERIGLRLEQNR